jgi:hypothetical protein
MFGAVPLYSGAFNPAVSQQDESMSHVETGCADVGSLDDPTPRVLTSQPLPNVRASGS